MFSHNKKGFSPVRTSCNCRFMLFGWLAFTFAVTQTVCFGTSTYTHQMYESDLPYVVD